MKRMRMWKLETLVMEGELPILIGTWVLEIGYVGYGK
jgi:hypothetical protein